MTPRYWLSHCYPSFSTMTTFITNLRERIIYLNKYIEDINAGKEIRKFKLGLFYD